MNKLLQHLKEGISSIDDIISLYESEDSERNNSFFLRSCRKAKTSAEVESTETASESDSPRSEPPNSQRLSNGEVAQQKLSDIPSNDPPQQQDKTERPQARISIRSETSGYGDEEITPLPPKSREKRCSCGGQLKRKTVSEICQLTAINAQLGEQYAQLRTEYVKLTADYSRLQYRHDLLKVAALKGRQVSLTFAVVNYLLAILKGKLTTYL
ncbi:unnamed protein product [Schistocephalus solidus]|uniref:Uncharacterized protein n=1 Tax=Schistocephalus solidus TaxID=70667 RepID=A0A183T3I6_SCHSO|nr:unnamed protein product [Schistocephalus solidus]